jgi:lactoylglutathione lyase
MPAMKYLHTMVRVTDIEASLRFYRDALGLELSRRENEGGRFTLVFLCAPGDNSAQVELTYNWPAADGSAETYTGGRNFGHLAYAVDDIYATCQRLAEHGVRSTARRATAAWPLCVRPTAFRWNCCRPAPRWRRPNPGLRCPTPAPGSIAPAMYLPSAL